LTGFKKILCFVLALLLLSSLFVFAETGGTITKSTTPDSTENAEQKNINYQQYFDANSNIEVFDGTLSLGKENIANEHTDFADISDDKGLPLVKEGSEITFKVNVEKTALYPISMQYYSYESTGADIEISLLVNSKIPFTEAERIFLPKLWQYDLAEDVERFEKDNRGNEQLPLQKEVQALCTEGLRDKEGYFDEAFLLKLEAGENLITIKSLKESFAVKSVILNADKKAPSYEEYLKSISDKKVPEASPIIIEAEKPFLRSTARIYPSFDRSSPDISPSDPAKIKLNIVGGSSTWKDCGDWVSYKVKVEKAGLYNISFKYCQNSKRGLTSIRKITVDDKVLFDELNEVEFGYSLNWKTDTLKDENGAPYKFYLTEGEHIIKLEAKLGEYARTLRVIESAVGELNEIYRKIVMVTGISPDPYRDYLLDDEIDGLVDSLKSAHKTLVDELEIIENRAGSSGTEAAFFYDLIRQLDSFIEDTHNITSEASRLDRFKQNISGLAELLLRLKEQPLMLDYIQVLPDGSKANTFKANIIEKLVYRFQSFVFSFFEDYTSIGNAYDEKNQSPLKIWVSVNDMMTTGISSGRDQAELLKRIIDEDLTNKTGLKVNLSLVNTSDTLLQAIVGGNYPDVALFVPKGMPINLAMRGALTDISQFEEYEEIKERFHPSAMIANIYNGGVYGVPETQGYNMLFYRKDIFEEQGLVPPSTWEEFYDVVSKLQKKNMQVGIPENQSIFEMLLLQNGGNIYNEALSEVTLTTKEAVKAFSIWTDLYKQYELPLAFDFFNRFRTGEMPMGIISFTMYNQLSVAAPEIRNLWEMVPVPGVETENGINRAQSCTGSSAIIPKASKRQKEAIQFIDWWTSASIQTRFGNEIETILGTSARYNTANMEAFDALKWSQSEMKNLTDARESISDIYQTPASYYITRNLTNAFRKVVYYYYNNREVLNKYASDMNNELKRKRQEFGLE